MRPVLARPTAAKMRTATAWFKRLTTERLIFMKKNRSPGDGLTTTPNDLAAQHKQLSYQCDSTQRPTLDGAVESGSGNGGSFSATATCRDHRALMARGPMATL